MRTGAGSKAHRPLVPWDTDLLSGLPLGEKLSGHQASTPITLSCPSGLCGLFPKSHMLVGKFTLSPKDKGST